MRAGLARRTGATAMLVLCVLLSGCATRRAAPEERAAGGDAATRPTEAVVAAAERPRAKRPPIRPAPSPPAAADPAAIAAGPPEPLRDGVAVFSALRAQLSGPSCPEDRVVQRWIAFYGRAPDRLADNLGRILPTLAFVVEEVRRAGLPGEYALLPIVESWYRPDARNGGTAGMWQFSAATARGHGLRVGGGVDERYSPRKATRAAIEHLAALQARFGDWRLAVMAYNAGEYRLQRVLAAGATEPSPAANQPAGLSATTYEHLAKLLALACLVDEPERIGLRLPTAAFAEFGVDPERTPAGQRSARRYQVKPGDSLWLIARRHGVSLANLLRWNALDSEAVLRPGQMLRVRP